MCACRLRILLRNAPALLFHASLSPCPSRPSCRLRPQMPYLLTPEAKSRIMHGEAAMEQQQHLSNAAMQALFQGVR